MNPQQQRAFFEERGYLIVLDCSTTMKSPPAGPRSNVSTDSPPTCTPARIHCVAIFSANLSPTTTAICPS